MLDENSVARLSHLPACFRMAVQYPPCESMRVDVKYRQLIISMSLPLQSGRNDFQATQPALSCLRKYQRIVARYRLNIREGNLRTQSSIDGIDERVCKNRIAGVGRVNAIKRKEPPQERSRQVDAG
jgi:hypothetical protein